MEIRPIRTHEDHRAALAEIEARWGAPEDTEEDELKDNRPTREVEVADYFPSAPAGEGGQQDLCREGHGRIEARTYTASSKVDWTVSDRSNPGEPPLHPHPDGRRLYIPSAPLDIDRLSLMR
jgi:hypothetical protein